MGSESVEVGARNRVDEALHALKVASLCAPPGAVTTALCPHPRSRCGTTHSRRKTPAVPYSARRRRPLEHLDLQQVRARLAEVPRGLAHEAVLLQAWHHDHYPQAHWLEAARHASLPQQGIVPSGYTAASAHAGHGLAPFGRGATPSDPVRDALSGHVRRHQARLERQSAVAPVGPGRYRLRLRLQLRLHQREPLLGQPLLERSVLRGEARDAGLLAERTATEDGGKERHDHEHEPRTLLSLAGCGGMLARTPADGRPPRCVARLAACCNTPSNTSAISAAACKFTISKEDNAPTSIAQVRDRQTVM
eukprot:scaffold25995_cov70-Phaeocystis_antarctica.AAC.4